MVEIYSSNTVSTGVGSHLIGQCLFTRDPTDHCLLWDRRELWSTPLQILGMGLVLMQAAFDGSEFCLPYTVDT